MDKRIKGLIVACCALGVSMLVTAPAWSVAAPDAAAPSAATLDQLDEIVLNGKRMEQRMLESEQRFYQLYNKLNAREDFDVTCNYEVVNPNSVGIGALRTRQSCVPLFFTNAIDDERGMRRTGACGSSGPSFGLYGSSRFSFPATPAVTNSFYNAWDGAYSDARTADFSSSTPALSVSTNISPCVVAISERPHLMWLDRRAAFEENLTKIMRSEPQLQALGGQFESLIEESANAQKLATEARKLKVELRLAARKCPVPTSPRSATKSCSSG